MIPVLWTEAADAQRLAIMERMTLMESREFEARLRETTASLSAWPNMGAVVRQRGQLRRASVGKKHYVIYHRIGKVCVEIKVISRGPIDLERL